MILLWFVVGTNSVMDGPNLTQQLTFNFLVFIMNYIGQERGDFSSTLLQVFLRNSS